MFQSTFRLGALVLGLSALWAAAALGDASNTNPKVDTTKPTPVVYPENAQRAGEEGTVVVGVYVTESGRVTRANVAKSSGYTDLDNAAIETAMRWHFVPAIHSGKVAADWASVQVVYKLPQNAAR